MYFLESPTSASYMKPKLSVSLEALIDLADRIKKYEARGVDSSKLRANNGDGS